MFRDWRKYLCALVAVVFVSVFIIPIEVFAQGQQSVDMEQKCKATKDGTETDNDTKKFCASYFEQTGGASAAGMAAGSAASTGIGKGTIAAIVVGVAAAGAAVAAAAGGGGGGGSSAASHHTPAR